MSKARKMSNKKRDFTKLFETIWEKYCARTQERPSREGLGRYLGISAAKLRSHARGQWPLAEELAIYAEKLNLDAAWLLTGKGKPDGSGSAPAQESPCRNAAGQIVGHLLRDTIGGALGMTPEDFATATGIGSGALEEILNGTRFPSWNELEAMARVFGVNAQFLLTGQGPDVLEQDELRRFCAAVGIPPEPYALQEALGVRLEDAAQELGRHENALERRLEWLRAHPADTENAPLPQAMPEAWCQEARERYGMALAWLAGDTARASHMRVRATDAAMTRLDGLIARLRACGGTDAQVQALIQDFAHGAENAQERHKPHKAASAQTAHIKHWE